MTLHGQLVLTVAFLISAAMGQYQQRPFSLQEILSPLNTELATEIIRMGRQVNTESPTTEATPINLPAKPRPHYIDPRDYQYIPRNSPLNQNILDMSLPRNLQYSQTLPQISRMQDLPPTQIMPQQSVLKYSPPVSSVPVSVPPSQYDSSQNLQQKSQQVSRNQLPEGNNFVLPSSKEANKNSKRDLFSNDPFNSQMGCNNCFKNNPFDSNFPVGEFSNFPEMSGFKENLCMNPTPPCSTCGFSSFNQNLMGNPYLPIASPVSPYFPPCGMPPASPNNARCHFLRKIPIPPPTL